MEVGRRWWLIDGGDTRDLRPLLFFPGGGPGTWRSADGGGQVTTVAPVTSAPSPSFLAGAGSSACAGSSGSAGATFGGGAGDLCPLPFFSGKQRIHNSILLIVIPANTVVAPVRWRPIGQIRHGGGGPTANSGAMVASTVFLFSFFLFLVLFVVRPRGRHTKNVGEVVAEWTAPTVVPLPLFFVVHRL